MAPLGQASSGGVLLKKSNPSCLAGMRTGASSRQERNTGSGMDMEAGKSLSLCAMMFGYQARRAARA